MFPFIDFDEPDVCKYIKKRSRSVQVESWNLSSAWWNVRKQDTEYENRGRRRLKWSCKLRSWHNSYYTLYMASNPFIQDHFSYFIAFIHLLMCVHVCVWAHANQWAYVEALRHLAVGLMLKLGLRTEASVGIKVNSSSMVAITSIPWALSPTLVVCFWDKVFLYVSRWLHTTSAAQSGLELMTTLLPHPPLCWGMYSHLYNS